MVGLLATIENIGIANSSDSTHDLLLSRYFLVSRSDAESLRCLEDAFGNGAMSRNPT